MTYNKRVPLCCEDLQRVDGVWLAANRVGFDDCHVMVVNAKDVERVARQGHEPEAVS